MFDHTVLLQHLDAAAAEFEANVANASAQRVDAFRDHLATVRMVAEAAATETPYEG